MIFYRSKCTPTSRLAHKKMLSGWFFVDNSIATELLQRLEFVQKIDAPLEGFWLQARYFILLSIPASASVGEQKSVTDSQLIRTWLHP